MSSEEPYELLGDSADDVSEDTSAQESCEIISASASVQMNASETRRNWLWFFDVLSEV